MDLEKVAEWMTQVTPVRSMPELCVGVRSGRVACQACVDVCSAKAVTLGKGKGPVISDACTACGLCVAACHTAAIRMDEPSDSSLLASARKLTGDTIICACPAVVPELQRTHRDQVLAVPCIGALSYELLTGLLATGHRRVVLWRSAQCDGCPNGAASDRLMQMAVAAVAEISPGRVEVGTPALPAATGASAATVAGAALEQDLIAKDRRAFLGSVFKDGAGGLASLLLGDWFRKPAPAEPPKRSLHDVTAHSRRREILHQALAVIDPPGATPLPETAIEATPDCMLCQVCAKLCPSGALRLTEAENQASLNWKASVCTGCGLCQATCPAKALRSGERLSVGRFLAPEAEVLIAGERTTCACGKSFWQVPGGPDKCMACRMRTGGWA